MIQNKRKMTLIFFLYCNSLWTTGLKVYISLFCEEGGVISDLSSRLINLIIRYKELAQEDQQELKKNKKKTTIFSFSMATKISN